MKNFLLIGSSQGLEKLLSDILRHNGGTCFQEETMFGAIKMMYGKKIDTAIISSKELAKQKLNFLEFIRKHFSSIKLFISIDNGINGFCSIPEGVDMINPDERSSGASVCDPF